MVVSPSSGTKALGIGIALAILVILALAFFLGGGGGWGSLAGAIAAFTSIGFLAYLGMRGNRGKTTTAATAKTTEKTKTTTEKSEKKRSGLWGWAELVLWIAAIALLAFLFWTGFSSAKQWFVERFPAIQSDGRGGIPVNNFELIREGHAQNWVVSFNKYLEPARLAKSLHERGQYKRYRLSDDSVITTNVRLYIYMETGAQDPTTGLPLEDLVLGGSCKGPQIVREGLGPRTACEGDWKLSGNIMSGKFTLSHNGVSATARLFKKVEHGWSEILVFSFYPRTPRD